MLEKAEREEKADAGGELKNFSRQAIESIERMPPQYLDALKHLMAADRILSEEEGDPNDHH